MIFQNPIRVIGLFFETPGPAWDRNSRLASSPFVRLQLLPILENQ